ncbi:MAG: hypothetical protein K2K00_07475 [Muribaculaceae bacterium]|nr:hypothetical protein [Muribaculaceae bacterium]
MMINRSVAYFVFMAVMFFTAIPDACAQRFSVASFRPLPNDVSAFINPVRDLNDEDCGLIKVIASDDFVFSTPLGIAKRDDKVGEIWLYLPKGSKKMTIKHAEWGVLRDYVFPTRIDSHMTYELRIEEPDRPPQSPSAQPIITTVVDTLVLTRVDTLIVKSEKKPIPFNAVIAATLNFGGKLSVVSGGLFLVANKRHGGFAHIMTYFGRIGSTIGECGKHGEINGAVPYYTGRTRRSFFMANIGLSHRLSRLLTIFEGVGYSGTSVAWELAHSEGGGYVRNSYYCNKGVSFEAGAMLTFNRIVVTAAVMTLKGSEWFGSVGIGIRLGK